ncbi:hypothetical protein GCK72_016703 [Caenorhabditis remanei]|uniref:C-type lectin domain-containing protein n=1 Tax=Caenorhabditis remanei TaxID=31234 RepID=A0A6A5G5L1_CAERE|nr:hypothetical protein GCK72_016703 [Caenorhabditis remanei]KAF1750156.1 hypothetical protein GCK72_016703 [Caenorhabditis remanei]
MFQLISDVPNNCTTHPHCLGFTPATFNHSIIFMNTANHACTQLLDEKFKMPKCPTGWNSWTRPTGRLWCYMISDVAQVWNSAESYCRDTWNASLNGFQTNEEREDFFGKMEKLELTQKWLYLGAKRSCETETCPKSVEFLWQNDVSTDQSLANDNFYAPYFDGSGDCLAMMIENGQYDDISCVEAKQTTFSCGKWADVYD